MADSETSAPTGDRWAGRRPEAKGLTKAQIEDLLVHFLADPVLALREILPHWFPKKMPWAHRGILALALERSDFLLNFGPEHWEAEPDAEWTIGDLRKIEKHFVVDGTKLFEIQWEDGVPSRVDIVVSDKMITVLPRGFSKTTLFKGIIILSILYLLEKVILYVSEAGPHAEAQVHDIRMELEFNDKIRELYGVLAPERQDPRKWTDAEFETTTGVHVIARGRGGQVRGLNRSSTRPGFILFDDIEDEESVSTEEQRRKVRKWVRGALERAGKLIGRTKIFGIGTILAYDALIPTLRKARSYMVLEFGAVDLDGEALWAEAMTLEKLEQTKLDYAETGDLPVFYREIMSRNVPDEDKKFNLDGLVYTPRRVGDLVARAISIDPAISKKKGSSLCAFAVVGITDKGVIHVCETFAQGGMNPDQQVDKYFELALAWECTHHGVEAIAYQQALIHLLQAEMFRRAKLLGPDGRPIGTRAYFEITPIHHNTDEAKHKRIEAALQPRYKSGYITHQKVFAQLETALRDWPDCQKDLPDAVAMAVTLLDPLAGLGADDITEEEELHGVPDVEEELGGDFRFAP